MPDRAVFYRLTQKFVNTERDIPEAPRQVLYYSLAIGHHVGVMDCFHSWLEVPLDEYRAWLAHMPAGAGRHKLEGLLKWGEIEINHTHVSELAPALRAAQPHVKQAEAQHVTALLDCLQHMLAEPALYLMVRMLP